MTDNTLSGENRLKRRERLTIALIIAGFIGGFGLGFGLAFFTEGDLFDPDTAWPPTLAVAAVAYFLTIVPALVIVANKTADEMELCHQRRGFEFGVWTLFFAYPSWYALWKGDLLPEPSHEAVFLGTLIATTIGYCYSRFR
ncbi:hypothetical protein [Sphingomicrobium clamense]|uniref:Uncharacterized protein n=1 Tax=Sphingomicrobium clamense TaxID=2851013 RepID=A0ABS6V5I2_9SPHN|nr:hypothetical protein [Sphingomicrobium sp. B8]MBW0144820.1 hypothetical protein [Sphingomicrobium sp. B8]